MYNNEPIGYSICSTCGMKRSIVGNTKCICQLKEDLKQLEQEIEKIYISLTEDRKIEIKKAIRMASIKKRITPENITVLPDNHIFVFGSNLSGYHGKGAALLARKEFGAIYGNPLGLQGNTYAIPTKGVSAINSLEINTIRAFVTAFIEFAKSSPELTFWVTAIGCGLAGYQPEDIAPLFKDAIKVYNICLPESFWQILLSK